jgi:hypothetical protein
MKDRAFDPKPARPDDSPFPSLARALDERLRAEAPGTFAGIVQGPDGAVEVFVTVSDPTLGALVEDVHASTGRRVPVRVVAGMKNNLASLESVFARVRARAQELHDHGVALVQFGVHVPANRVLLGVEGLTREIAESLGREFGSDQVEVFECGLYRPT